MRLYTFQPLPVYDLFCREGVFHSRPLQYPESFLGSYSYPPERPSPQGLISYGWVCDQLQRRGLARPADDVYPVWAYYRWYFGNSPTPDLRTEQAKAVASLERMVMMTLEVPDAEVMLLDYEDWHLCLNYSYLGTMRDGDDFERRMKKAGIPQRHDMPYPEPFHTELLASWERVLDPHIHHKRWRGRKGKQTIQAVFWTLRAEHVVSVVEYGVGRPKVKRPVPGDCNPRRSNRSAC